MNAERELKAEIVLAASPEKVWATITDFKELAKDSPELLTMFPLKTGGLRHNQWYVGINRRKGVVWPTRNVVAVLDPGRTLAWDTKTSGARWIFELKPEGAGTRLIQRRPIPQRRTMVGRVFAMGFLGGKEEHDDELEAGMLRTLEGIKASLDS